MKKILLHVIATVVAMSAAFSQEETIKQNIRAIYTEALVKGQSYQMLEHLCLKIGHRLSGSPQAAEAVTWTEQKMKQLGFDTVFLQPVMVPQWTRGKTEKAEIITKKGNPVQVNVLAIGNSVGTGSKGVTAKIVEVKNLSDLEQLGKEKVEGKIVYFSRPFDQSHIRTFHAYSGAVDQRVFGASEAAKYGAVAVVVRSMSSTIDDYPHTGTLRYNEDFPKLPAVAISTLDGDMLSEMLKENSQLELYIETHCEMKEDVLSYNVVGEIRGSEKPNEYIIVGGHLDSWDVGHGAHDDGAGCVQSMEVLYLLKQLGIKPKRTIRCVLFINEENGSRGGKGYGKFAEENNENHIAAIESDRGGFTPIGFDVEPDSANLNKIKNWLSFLEKSGINWIKKGGSGVDIQYIKNTKAKLGYVPDAQRYMDVHHSANDTFDSVHPRELELGTSSIAIMAYLISEEGL